MTDIRSLTIGELKEKLAAEGEKPFRAGQIFAWLHKKRVLSFDEMTDLSKELRRKLSELYVIEPLRTVEVQTSALDGTKKFLFALSDGNVIESVFMRYREWNAVCISSQVGCAMGCRFCASTVEGCVRDLTAAEMLDEVYAILRETGESIGSVVVMGSGEPLLNYDNLLRFIENLSSPEGMDLSQRSITVSTCGIVPQMKRLAGEHLQINLAVSLHASEDKKRRQLMPVAEKYTIRELLDACGEYFRETGRRLSFEYALVAGVNDTGGDAERLAGLLRGMNCYVNLIPVNPVRETGLKRPKREAALRFKEMLERRGISAAVRRELGSDIDGACGQLRRRRLT